jgi:SWI/SNF-related matrix-associated actin-dependent regulator 1 of chromatin subfamily A
MNYEMLDDSFIVDWILKQRFDMLVCDESHKIKATDGRRAKAAWKLGAQIKYKIIQTGTLLPHTPLDGWSQFKVIDPGVLGPSVTQFKARYAVTGGFNGKEIVRWQNEDELNEKIYSISFRVGADVLDLPPVRHEEVKIELSKRAQELYDELENDFFAKIDDTKQITVANVLVQILRQQQITSGFLPDDSGGVTRIDYGKQDALENILDGIARPKKDSNGRRIPGEPLVVFAKFRHDLDVIKDSATKMGFAYAELSGRKDELKMWQEGEADVIGVQIQSGGSGISLVRARYCVYYSVGYSLGDYLQSLKRVHRPEQEHAVTYYHLVARGFIDSDVYSALQNHADIVDKILDKIKISRPIAHTLGKAPKE